MRKLRQRILLNLLVCVVFLLMALLYSRIIIEGDGISYYALVLSLTRDLDFDLENQKKEIKGVMAPVHPVTGKNASLFSAGFGLVYAPFLQVSDWIQSAVAEKKEWKPYRQNRQFPFHHAAAIFVGTLIFSGLSIYFASRLIRETADEKVSGTFIPILMFTATPLIFYTFSMPAYAHAADTFLITIAFYLVMRERTPSSNLGLRDILLGILLSLSVTLRNNNIVLIVPAVCGLIYLDRSRGFYRLRSSILYVVAGAIPASLVLVWFNLQQYGNIIATGYRIQGEATFLREMLFHPAAGLFVWSPISLVAFGGLMFGTFRKRADAVISLAAVLLVFFSVQFQPNWWGGCSFGQRFFTHLFPFWCIGLAYAVRGSQWLIIPSAICALWSFCLFNTFYLNTSTAGGWEMLKKDQCRHHPVEMISQAKQDYDEARKEGTTASVPDFWFAALGKRYPTLIHVLAGGTAP